MARQQFERLDFADRSRMTDLRMDREAGSCFGAGFYFRFYESCHRMAAAITRTVAVGIRPSDHFFGSYATAATFTPGDLRFAWFAVMAGIAGLATLLLLGWSEIGAGPVSATERRADPSSSPPAAPRVKTQAEMMEVIRRRGLELLRADFPEEEPSPSLARGDRLKLHDATIKPAMRIATAGEDDDSVAAPAPLPARPAASKPAEAKKKQAVKERRAHRGHARRASRHHRDRVRAAHAKYVQVAGEPQVTSTGGLQPDRAPPEENNKAFGWVKRLPEAIVPSLWKGGWENLSAKGNGGGGSSCSPSVNPAIVCPREAHVGPQ
jgi:hypothetical protein